MVRTARYGLSGINTIVATVLFAMFYYAFAIRGWTFDDLPNFLPTK